MSSVDDRIVNMQFNNKQFVSGAAESQRALQGLDQTIAATAKGPGLTSMQQSVEGVTGKFTAMRIAGVAAIATVAAKATAAGLRLAKSIAIDPIVQGFQEYELNLKSIQTVMANTGEKIGTVNKYMKELNVYSDKTVYNFSQMAENIGRFTAAGVALPDATAAIKGMANTAALVGADTNQLNSAMYQMSQALSTGTIRLMDWNSLSNANMGTVNIQNALKATAETMKGQGAAMKDAIANAGNFRDSLQAGWLSADIFTKSMKVMAGTLTKGGKPIAYTVEQLQKMGYARNAAEDLHRLSQASIDSATQIKTFTQLVEVVKESIGSGWAQVFQGLFGNLNEAKALWTGVGKTITDAVSNIFGSINKMLTGWREAGGFDAMWAGFGNIFQALGNLIHPFVAAFATLFPTAGKAGEGLANFSKGFESVTEVIEAGTKVFSDYLTPVLVTVFSSFKMVGEAISFVVNALKPFAPLIKQAVSAVGDLASEGAGIAQSLIDGLVGGLDPAAIQAAVVDIANNIIEWIKGVLGIHSPSTEMVEIGVNIVQGLVMGLIQGLGMLISGIAQFGSAIVEGFGKLFAGFDAQDFASLLNTVLTGGMILAFTQLTKTLNSWANIGSSAVGVLDGIGDSLKAWQNSLKAKMILEIAIAIGILTAAVIALSFIDPKKLAVGLGAITTMMGTLSGTLLLLSKINSDVQIAVLASSIVLIAGAMVALAGAVAILGTMDYDTLAKGLGSLAAILALLVGTVKGMSGAKGQFVAAGAGIVLMALAINIMVSAIALLGNMDMGTLAKGLGAMAVGLALMTLSLKALSGSGVGKSALKSAGAIVLVAGSMLIMAAAVAAFGNMDLKTLAKGFGAVAVGLALMVGAILVLSGVGPAALAAAGAMVLMASALNILMSVILVMGSTPWDVIGKGLTVVALALAILIAAGYLAEAAAPGLLALSIAVLALGAGMALAGVGMAAFGTGFALMAATGTAGIAVIVAAIHAFLALLPEIAVQVANSFIAFIKVIANAAGEIRIQFGKIFTAMLGVISDNMPKVIDLVVQFITKMLQSYRKLLPEIGKLLKTALITAIGVVEDLIPRMATAGVKIVLGILTGIGEQLYKFVNKGTELVVKFLRGLGQAVRDITDAAGQLILDILEAIDAAVVKYTPQYQRVGADIAGHVVDGMTFGLAGKLQGAIDDAASEVHVPGISGSEGTAGGHALDFDNKTSDKRLVEPLVADKRKPQTPARAVAEAIRIADKVISEGNKKILAAQKAARRREAAQSRAQTEANIAADRARDAQRFADEHEKNRAAQVRARKLARFAKQQQTQADKAQKAFDAARNKVESTRQFQQADLHEKGDIKAAQSQNLASRANIQLAKANAEAAEARRLMHTNRKAGRAMLKQAQRDTAAAKRAALAAQRANAEAARYYEKEVENRIKSLRADEAARVKEEKEAAEFEAADAQGKADILNARAAKDEAVAEKARKDSKRLIAQAKRLADTNAKKAMQLLDKAEKLTQKAQEAADRAEQERQEAEDALGGGAGGGGGASLIPSRTILEDAASAVDRYTRSLQLAEDLAAAQSGVVQFVQNNNSPEALSASQIYRQTRNLLSAAEVKMGASTE